MVFVFDFHSDFDPGFVSGAGGALPDGLDADRDAHSHESDVAETNDSSDPTLFFLAILT